MNHFDNMRAAIQEADVIQRAAKENASQMGSIIASNGRIRSVNPYTLCKLKRQLADFNMTTCQWKD